MDILITSKDAILDTLKRKLYKESSQNPQYNGQVTALISSSQNGNLEAVKLFMDKMAESDQLAKSDRTAAFISGFPSGHITIVNLVLKENSPFNAKKTLKFTDLMAASLNGHTEVVELLADNGAELNLKNEDGATALIFASQHGNAELVRLLLEKGANPGLKDNEGKTALDYAYSPEVRSLLLR
jgi:ankyrin repeat protein